MPGECPIGIGRFDDVSTRQTELGPKKVMGIKTEQEWCGANDEGVYEVPAEYIIDHALREKAIPEESSCYMDAYEFEYKPQTDTKGHIYFLTNIRKDGSGDKLNRFDISGKWRARLQRGDMPYMQVLFDPHDWKRMVKKCRK